MCYDKSEPGPSSACAPFDSLLPEMTPLREEASFQMMATSGPGHPFWAKRLFQILACVFMVIQLLLLLAFGIDLLTRAIPYTSIIWMGVLQGLLLVLLGLLYLRWSQIVWPVLGRWQFTRRVVSKLGALGLICLGIAVSLWFFFRYQGIEPSNASYGFALGLVILGLILLSFGIRQGLNSQTGHS